MQLRNGKIIARECEGTIGYKVCIDPRSKERRLVTLLIPNGALNNVNRDNVVDRKFAKHRCSEARVLSIDPPGPAVSMYDRKTTYEVGMIVKPNSFDANISNVCTGGIHYFLDKECALNYENKIPEAFTGVWRKWFDDGQLQTEDSYKDGQMDGVCKSWYENGRPLSEEVWKNGQEDGVWKSWYENGQPRSKGVYKNGKRDGVWKSWYVNGQLESEGVYKNGQRDGVCKECYENGQPWSEGSYKNGQRDGVRKTWYGTGQPKSESVWKNGRMDGFYKEWNENGQLVIEQFYIN